MTANETALREYRAALEQLASTLKTAKIRAERDDTPPVLTFYLGLADNLVSRLHFLSNYIDVPPAVSVTQLGPQEPPDDPMIYNRRQADGTFRSLAGFWERDEAPPAGEEA